MNDGRRIDVLSARGKVIESFEIYDNSPSGREVLVRFSDGTELSVEVEVGIVARAKRYRPAPGDFDILESYEEKES